ncbi:CotO family spore coat protein [Paenibacillus sp. BSR1-1]|uniref:CotO family spore coat protein n=1 Tax=Paenibacillus sp. BSR1-1 TaxID=3020845 RepID=UPI0025B1A9B8|nr:CotO family spore coat protein [Paenibacillus sp. BSR1-1]MDN3015056.1 CotO family spore coat protein [Paenibacillus sp. BSR1-1]
MSKKRSQEPLLFTNQPISQTPSNHNMQEIYTNRHEREQQKEDNHIVETKKRVKKEAIPDDIAMDVNKKESKTNQEKIQSSMSRVKPFKEMNIVERIEYLLNFPKVLPPAPCVIYTAKNRYQGYITEYADNRVTIQSPDQSSNTILLEDIKNVIMIGIKR